MMHKVWLEMGIIYIKYKSPLVLRPMYFTTLQKKSKQLFAFDKIWQISHFSLLFFMPNCATPHSKYHSIHPSPNTFVAFYSIHDWCSNILNMIHDLCYLIIKNI